MQGCFFYQKRYYISMHKILITNIEFFGVEEYLRTRINLENINSLKRKDIKRIGRTINNVFFDIYKRNLFFEYFDLNRKPTTSFINKSNKLLKELEI